MRTWYLEKGDVFYECPYCHMEIGDYTGERVESGKQTCPECFEEFYLEVEE